MNEDSVFLFGPGRPDDPQDAVRVPFDRLINTRALAPARPLGATTPASPPRPRREP